MKRDTPEYLYSYIRYLLRCDDDVPILNYRDSIKEAAKLINEYETLVGKAGFKKEMRGIKAHEPR